MSSVPLWFKKIVMDINELTRKIIGAAIEVHREKGPGLLESIYEECMDIELELQEMRFERQKRIPLTYKGRNIPVDLRTDLVVENQVIVELKAVEKLLPIHKAQVLTYLKLTGCKIGLLINFNVTVLKNGIKRIIN